MITIQYVFLHFLLWAIVAIFSLKISSQKSSRKYWSIACVPIIAMTIEKGFRWGRHIDWCAYYYQYQYMVDGLETTHEPFFRFIWGIFASLNMPYPIVIAFCSFLLVYSLFYFFKPYKNLIYILLPFLIVWVAPKAINLIRWYMGLSFLLIAFRCYLDKRKLVSLVFSLFSFFTHYAMLPLILLFLLITVFKRRICKPWIIIFVSLGLIFFFSSSFMSRFAPILENLSNIERFSGYAMNAEGWLTGEGQNAAIEKKSTVIYILTSLPFYLYILYGSGKKTREEIVFYNLAIIDLVLRSISSGLELLGRYTASLDPFLIFIAANAVYSLRNSLPRSLLKGSVLIIINISIFIQVCRFCAPMGRQEYMHYVWNQQIVPSKIYDLYMSD